MASNRCHFPFNTSTCAQNRTSNKTNREIPRRWAEKLKQITDGKGRARGADSQIAMSHTSFYLRAILQLSINCMNPPPPPHTHTHTQLPPPPPPFISHIPPALHCVPAGGPFSDSVLGSSVTPLINMIAFTSFGVATLPAIAWLRGDRLQYWPGLLTTQTNTHTHTLSCTHMPRVSS